MRLDLLSWNVHGPPLAPRRATRLNAVGLEIERRAPEIALLQEVWFGGDAAALARQLAPRYDVVDGAPRVRPVRAGGLLAFVRRDSEWRVADRGVRFERYRTQAARWRVWEGDGLAAKGIQIIPLVHRAAGRSIVMAHTHLQAQYEPIRHARPRGAQLTQLARLAATLGAATPVLAAGDLNTGPDDALYRDLIAPIWIDLTAPTRTARPAASTHFECASAPWIDYVLAHRSPHWSATGLLELIENRSRDDPFSDHHGLHVRLQIEP
jgi:endonuclease/exonuclease/phosphatase family metal-dependent hydrolase